MDKKTNIEDEKIRVLSVFWNKFGKGSFLDAKTASKLADVDEGIVIDLQEHGLLHPADSGRNRFKISQEGIRALQLHKNTVSSNNLAQIERKSSAVETMFTIALLLFTAVQILLQLVAEVPPLIKITFFLGTLMTTLGIIAIAWIIGGDNMLEIWEREYEAWKDS